MICYLIDGAYYLRGGQHMRKTLFGGIALMTAMMTGCISHGVTMSSTAGGYRQERNICASEEDQLCNGAERVYDVNRVHSGDFPVASRAHVNEFTPEK